ncbi:MAG TPA: response regulator [Streptosporangiaceae bacterium]
MTNKARILLVDDRHENLVALEAILSSLNQTLVTVRSGEEALKALLVDEFAVILLDVVMPGMDGFETASHIKRRPKTRDVPIIFLTAASAEPDHAFRGYAAGAVDYISKPFDPWVLRAKVAVFVELYAKNRQLQEQAELLRSRLGAPALERGAARKAISAPSSAEPGDAAGEATAPVTGEDAGQVAPAPAEQAGPVDAQPLLLELSSRLAAVEDLVGVLGTQPGVTSDDVLADCARQLEHRVGRLRDALDALRVG